MTPWWQVLIAPIAALVGAARFPQTGGRALPLQ